MTREDILIENEDKRQGCEVWTRVMGYYRPIRTADGDSRYNPGKQSEYDERVFFKQQE